MYFKQVKKEKMGKCHCRLMEIILSLIILVFLYWENSASSWVIGIVAILMLIHGLFCRWHGNNTCTNQPLKPRRKTKKSKPSKKKK